MNAADLARNVPRKAGTVEVNVFKAAWWLAVVALVGALAWHNRAMVPTDWDFPSLPNLFTPSEIELVAVVYESDPDDPEWAELPVYVFSSVDMPESYRTFDDDVTTGEDSVPEDVAAAVAEAKSHGLPALVVVRGGQAEAQAVPATKEAFLEAVK